MFQWLQNNYGWVVGGLIPLLVAIWKWIVQPAARLKRNFSAWLARDTTIKEDMTAFIRLWSPDGEDSGWDRMARVETNLELFQSTMKVRDRLDNTARFSCDEKGHVISVNRAFCRHFNITDDVALGWGWINLLSSEGNVRDDFRRTWMSSVESGMEFLAVVKTDSRFGHKADTVEIYASPVCGNEGKIIRWDGVMVPARSLAPIG